MNLRVTSLLTILFAAGIILAMTIPVMAMNAKMFRYPDVSADQIAFTYDNDVWVAPKRGGMAQPLSSPPGAEVHPKFNHDGSKIAFTGNYDGNYDVYEMPVAGGVARRLTYHPYTDRVVEYAPDGRVVFSSFRELDTPAAIKLFYADPDGGMPEALPMKAAWWCSFSDDGRNVAFVPFSREFSTWKRYQGGRAADIWLFDLENYESQRLTDFPGTDDLPMFSGEYIYYLSDAGKHNRRNIWRMLSDGSAKEQLTFFSDYDVKWPSIGPLDIVFENGGCLYLLELLTGSVTEVEISVPGDHPNVRPQQVEISGVPSSVTIGPTGSRLVASMHGDIWTIPVDEGYNRSITRTDDFYERYPAWSPDGKWVAFAADYTGDYEIYIAPSDGGEPQQLTFESETWYLSITWSPDSQKLALTDQSGAFYVYDMETDSLELVARDKSGSMWLTPSWAPDSNWLAYPVMHEETLNYVVMLYDWDGNESYQISSEFYNSYDPVFGRGGEYLFFTTNRNFSPIFSDVDDAWTFANSTVIAAVPLTDDIQLPTMLENSEEPYPADEEAAEGEGESQEDGTGEAEESDTLVIDTTGSEARALTLPVQPGNLYGLQAANAGLLFLRSPNSGTGGPTELYLFDVANMQEIPLAQGVFGVEVSADGNMMAVADWSGIHVVPAQPGVQLGAPVSGSSNTITVNPRDEWRQMVWDTYRLYKYFFYDPNLHGVDWEEVRDQALGWVEHAANRSDLFYIIGEMIGELNVGHAYTFSYPFEETASLDIGLLGADVELAIDEHGATGYRITKIFSGLDADHEVRSPLAKPGLDVAEGDFILAVNGIPVDTGKSFFAAFQGMAGDVVSLSVNATASVDENVREVLVRPVGDEMEYRLRNWIEANRQYVSDKTDGRVGYIYVRDTAVAGMKDLMRQYSGQWNLDGLIIDERWNGGGFLPHRMIEVLNRPLMAFWSRRYGYDWRSPGMGHAGPKVMLINEAAGSGGDMFPYLFRHTGLGKLIGTRTWGGLVGLTGNPGLLDGYVSVPQFGIYELDGTWAIEGHGVDPDIEVIADPTELANGIDPQLEKAIEVIRAELTSFPWVDVDPPAYPDRSGAGIPEDER